MIHRRILRARVLEALELRARQFRSREEIFPFRAPPEPIDLAATIREALVPHGGGHVGEDELRSRTVLSLHWKDGTTWSAWAITLPSGVHLYCDSDPHETRILASVKRGSAVEADGFFLELLAESSGHHFGIEMAGDAPDAIRTSIPDRDFLADVFVELFEGSPAEASIHAIEDPAGSGHDFRADVEHWLTRVLVTQPHAGPRKRLRRLRDEPLDG